jgi:CDP-paratose 2-epimerase
MKILITGACGFVGSAIVSSFHGKAFEIFALDNLSREGSETRRMELKRRGVKMIHADLRVASDIEGLPAADWVIAAAANCSVLAGLGHGCSSRQLVEHNLLGIVNLLEYCKRFRAGFTFLSTSRVYSLRELAEMEFEVVERAFAPKPDGAPRSGVSERGISETFSTAPPVSLYGSAKLSSETLAVEYGETFGFPVWINRCGVLAGAGQFGRADQGIFTFWINSYLRGRPLRYCGFGGHGFQVRDCMHPQDLAPLLRRQMENPAGGHERILNVGGGVRNTISLARLSEWCSARFGPREIQRVPEGRPFDVPWLVLDSSLAKSQWDWEPSTSLHAILSEIANHAERHPDWLEISRAV